jgi:queuine tRNA-ribosyltransferase
METPAFMPVGTYGAVKGVHPTMLAELGAEMVLANAYHLHDRPGEDEVASLGGLHRFMNWDGLILTDSGGFQIFSLLDIAELDEDGVSFRSPVDGRRLRLGPESIVDIQLALDSDVAMVLDQCPPLPTSHGALETAVRRTTRWARRARDHHRSRDTDGQALFAIVQGGLDTGLRERSARELTELDFDGYAMGGLSVGEGSEAMQAAAARFAPLLPEDRVRYIMGVGRPADVLAAIAAGFDVFDCVLPTRNGRHGTLFVDKGLADSGVVHLRNRRFRGVSGPIDPECDCPACRHWDVGVLRHHIVLGDPLGRTLCTAHNLRYLFRLVQRTREAIAAGSLDELLGRYGVRG